DAPPALRFEVKGAGQDGHSLLKDTILEWSIDDDSGIDEFVAVVTLDGGPVTLQLPRERRTGQLPLGVELAKSPHGTGSHGKGRVVLQAKDRARNPCSSEPLQFDVVDVDVPVVEVVTGAHGELPISYLGGTALLQVRLSTAEPGLAFSVKDAEGRE